MASTGPGIPIVAASSQGWATWGSQLSTALNSAWFPDVQMGSTGLMTVNCSPASSAGSFYSSGDGTSGTGNGFYTLGRRVKVVQSSSTITATITAASVATGVTLVSFSTATDAVALSTAAAITSVSVGAVIPDTNLSVKRLISRYLNSATLNITNSAAGTYVDFGGSFTKTVTVLAADQVCIRIQSIAHKSVAGTMTVVVDRGGTKLPAAATAGSVYMGVETDFLPFAYEFWDVPSAGTFTYKPQLYVSDNNTASAGGGNYCQFVVEVWR